MTITPKNVQYVDTSGAARAVWNRRYSPFVAQNKVLAKSGGAATLYGVNHPGHEATTRVYKFYGDGTTTTFDVPSGFASLPTTNAASLDSSNYLEAIVLVGGEVEAEATMRERLGSDGSPSSTQWKVDDADTISFATAPADGEAVYLIVPDSSDIVQLTGGAFTADRTYEITCYDFFSAGTAGVSIFEVP